MIDKPEAAEALREMERIHRRTSLGGAYAKASPHLLFAGVLWTIGYIATGLVQPERWAMIWVPITLIGAAGSYAIAYASARSVAGNPAARTVQASRILWMMATAMVFTVATFLLFQPRDPLAYLAFPALLMAFLYVLIGSFGLSRFQWIGMGMFAVLIAGLIVGRESIAFWVAAAGGGGLILGGLWLRKV
jgi:hypothetical protein